MIWTDLHLHSPHALATSPRMTVAEVAASAREKGLFLVATGDFLHPGRRGEIASALRDAPEPGFLVSREGKGEKTRFVLGGEVNCVWRAGGRGRRVHLLLLVPTPGDAERIAQALAPHGRLASDGRPLLRLFLADAVAEIREAAPDAALILPHLWTPWYGCLGGKSGFDSVAEALGPLAGEIDAVETGMSSDPAMCRRLSSLDPYPALSFSDAHNPEALGREATAFAALSGWEELRRGLRTGEGVAATLEYFPAEGKYHLDGHRRCSVSFAPGEAPADGRCPACGKPLTPGVASRVEALADRPAEYKHPGAPRVFHAPPLVELAALSLGVGKTNAKARDLAHRAARAVGGEIAALTAADPDLLPHPRLAQAVRLVRAGRVEVEPGFDGRPGRLVLPWEA